MMVIILFLLGLLAATVSEDEGVVLTAVFGNVEGPALGFGAGPWW